MHRGAKTILLSLLLLGLGAEAGWYWRFGAVDVPVAAIEKVTEQGESPGAFADCQNFVMTPEEFRLYFKQAKRILEREVQDYRWLPCYYRAFAQGKEYRVRNGGIAEVRYGDKVRLYVRRDARRDD